MDWQKLNMICPESLFDRLLILLFKIEFNLQGRAKWDHWDKVKGKSTDEAMQAYIQ